MKNLLTLAFLLPLTCYAQELTAETTAVEPSVASQVAEWLWSAVAAGLLWLLKNALPLLSQRLKQLMHFRGSDVVADALTEVLYGAGDELRQALADGKITPEERQMIKDRTKAIAEKRLKELGGFYKSDLVGWINTQIDILLARVGISKAKDISANP
jgi:hypothetical protein